MSKLLVVEDDQIYANSLLRRLTKLGYQVFHAATPSEALLLARQHLPTAVILDMHLDGESGLSLITPMRNVLKDAKIVLLTGYASIATAVDAIKLGADNYLAKPADLDTIINALNSKPSNVHSAVTEEMALSAEQAAWEHIQQVLKLHNGNISAAARHMCMHRRTLQRKLQKRPSFNSR